MNAVTSPRILVGLSSFTLWACAQGSKAPPGYSGPLPSVAAQHALHQVEGQVLRGSKLGPSGQGLTIESFAVVPNPVTQLGPVVTLVLPGAPNVPIDARLPQGANGRWALPILTDGDAADLITRVTGRAPEGFAGATSAVYRQTMKLE